MEISFFQIIAAFCFLAALIHTFSVRYFKKLALKAPKYSIKENFYELFAEIEVVFALWSLPIIMCMIIQNGFEFTINYLDQKNFTEPAFIFVIMVICATQPILNFGTKLINSIAKLLPFHPSIAFYLSCLIIGPLTGSIITEPAAMTITAFILLENLYSKNISQKLKYATLSLLFVNISIGGTFTPFAAPPVLIIARKWGWDFNFMLQNFSWKACLAIVFSTIIITFKFKNELKTISQQKPTMNKSYQSTPNWIIFSHLIFLFLVITTAHYATVFGAIFLFFF
jgi:hypothetical protein